MTDDIEQLREETQTQDRLADNEPDTDNASGLDPFQEEFLRTLRESEGKVKSRNLSINDPMLWSVMVALENDEERYQRLQENVGASRQTRSSILSELIRVGLAELDPELAEDLNEALNANTPFSH